MTRKRQSREGVPGDTIAEARLWEEHVHKVGLAVIRLDRLMTNRGGTKRMIREIRVIKPTKERPEFLVVVKGLAEGKKVVGFHSALEPSDAIRGAVERYNNRAMRMRPDTPYQPKEG